MNIVFKTLKWNNFLSYGKEENSFDFNNGVDLLLGKNGMGKSAITEVIFYSLFGKPFRKIKLSSLVNKISKKNMKTILEFSIDNQNYKIIRGTKPNIFEIYIKNEEEWVIIPQKAATKDYQKMLEEEILNLNETIFRQLIVLGANLVTSKPFMELSQVEKENLFQVITDTSIFNDISTKIKEKISENKIILKDYIYRRDLLEETIKAEKIVIEEAEKRNKYFKETHEKNKEEVISQIKEAEEKILKYEVAIEKLKELKNKYDTLLKEITTKEENSKRELDTRINSLLEEQKTIKDEYSKELSNIEDDVELLNKKDILKKEVEDILKYKSNLEEENINTNTKIQQIIAAKKGSIICNNCSEINYISNIDKNEIIKEDEYKKTIKNNEIIINDLDNRFLELNNKISSVIISIEENTQNKRNDVHSKYENKLKNISDEILKERNKISSFDDEKNILNKYKEKLLNSKRIKENYEEAKTSLINLKHKEEELNNIKEIEIDYESIKNKEKEFSTAQKNIKKYSELMDDYEYLLNLVGSNNLKGAVIKRQIPFLNKSINHFLELFSMLEYSFVIDENFKERIISRNEDSEFNQLSNGQKSRISFSIMFAFLKIIEKRNGVKTNLLILDEILDSSVDSEGREELLNILKEEFSQTKDIIIISHNQEIQEKIELFDRVIKISKDKFSSIEVEEID